MGFAGSTGSGTALAVVVFFMVAHHAFLDGKRQVLGIATRLQKGCQAFECTRFFVQIWAPFYTRPDGLHCAFLQLDFSAGTVPNCCTSTSLLANRHSHHVQRGGILNRREVARIAPLAQCLNRAA